MTAKIINLSDDDDDCSLCGSQSNHNYKNKYEKRTKMILKLKIKC